LDLIKSERESLSAQKDAQKKLAELRKSAKGQTTPEIDYQNKRLMSAKIEYYIAKKARNSIKDLRAQGMERLEKDKAHVRDLAGLAVKAQFGQMLKRLTETLDQAEVLQYELYSGAGEHLRYQLAGGDVNPKERPELKVEKEKALNWEFRGEIWEDELGHYRSSLKNVCPPDDPMDKGSSAVAPAAAKPPKK
jgi:phage-related minor tail protein